MLTTFRRNDHGIALELVYKMPDLGTPSTPPSLRESHLCITLLCSYRIAVMGTRYTMPPLREGYLRTTLVFVYRVAGLGTRYTLPPLRKSHSTPVTPNGAEDAQNT